MGWQLWSPAPYGTPEYVVISGAGLVTKNGLVQTLSGNDLVADYLGVNYYGGFNDVFIRTRDSINDDFGAWVALKPPANSSNLECCADVESDFSTYYFTTDRPGGPGFLNLWEAPIAQSVPVDIKPGSDTTPINLKSKGVLPVAIYTTDGIDATQIDPETLLFGDPLLIADGQQPVSPLRWSIEDVNYDGWDDLSLKFSMRDLVDNMVLGDMSLEGYLAGQLYDGTEIAGRESIRIVPGPTAMSIPEPGSVMLLVAGVLLLFDRSRR